MGDRAGVYQIRNTLNGRVYFGSSRRVRKRLGQHRNALRKGTHGNPYLQAEFSKCGEDGFVFEPLAYCEAEKALFFEQRLLDKFHDGCDRCYDIALDAKAPGTGLKASPETRARMAAVRRGRKLSPAHRAKIAATRIGKPRFTGREHTPETKARMAESRRLFWARKRALGGAA